MNKVIGAKSTLDHFIVSDNLFTGINNYKALHEGDNLSDHSVVTMGINIPIVYVEEPINTKANPKLKWECANDQHINDYKCALDCLLGHVEIPWEAIRCNNVFCTDHNDSIDLFHNNIIRASIAASFATIPISKGGQPKAIPGWSDLVEGHRKTALFWHRMWKENNSPKQGVIFEIRKRTRAQYHMAIRNVQKNKETLKANSMANSLLANRNRDFWKEVKKVRGGQGSLPTNIDGTLGKENICNLFSTKYKTLYNSVSYNTHDMDNLMADISQRIANECCSEDCKHWHECTVTDIENAIRCLNGGKADGDFVQSTDHIIHGTKKLSTMLSLLFKSMTVTLSLTTGFSVQHHCIHS
jgi:hypothetical protein